MKKEKVNHERVVTTDTLEKNNNYSIFCTAIQLINKAIVYFSLLYNLLTNLIFLYKTIDRALTPHLILQILYFATVL